MEHNLPFEAAAHTGPLFPINPLFGHLHQNPFSLAIDDSSDTGTESMYPMVGRVYENEKREICSRFRHMSFVSDCSAEGIFTLVSKAFEIGMPWRNVIGLSLDNASVNMGRHNSLYRKFEAKNSNEYTFGCPCHIIHNCQSCSTGVCWSDKVKRV